MPLQLGAVRPSPSLGTQCARASSPFLRSSIRAPARVNISFRPILSAPAPRPEMVGAHYFRPPKEVGLRSGPARARPDPRLRGEARPPSTCPERRSQRAASNLPAGWGPPTPARAACDAAPRLPGCGAGDEEPCHCSITMSWVQSSLSTAVAAPLGSLAPCASVHRARFARRADRSARAHPAVAPRQVCRAARGSAEGPRRGRRRGGRVGGIPGSPRFAARTPRIAVRPGPDPGPFPCEHAALSGVRAEERGGWGSPQLAAITSGGAWTSSMSTPSPQRGSASFPFGWMKQTS